MTKERPILSFCIPVYNRGAISEEIVKGILESDEQCFEIVVSDNASTDDTQERLSRIHDPRFRYYRFDKEVPAGENWGKALISGEGEYLFLVMNRDKIRGESVGRLCEILRYARDNNILCMLDLYQEKRKRDIQVYEGIDAMIILLGQWHNTGNIFSRKVFHEVWNDGYYFKIADAYAENYFKRDMLIRGKGAYIASGVWRGEPFIKPSDVSTSPDFAKPLDTMVFSPRRRTKLFFEMIDMIEPEIPGVFSHKEINKFFRNKFSYILNIVSWEYRIMYSSKDTMFHYGHEAQKISFRESMSNILKVYQETKAHLKEKGTYNISKQAIMYYCLPISLLSFTAKVFFRGMLNTLGIWDYLKTKLSPLG